MAWLSLLKSESTCLVAVEYVPFKSSIMSTTCSQCCIWWEHALLVQCKIWACSVGGRIKDSGLCNTCKWSNWQSSKQLYNLLFLFHEVCPKLTSSYRNAQARWITLVYTCNRNWSKKHQHILRNSQTVASTKRILYKLPPRSIPRSPRHGAHSAPLLVPRLPGAGHCVRTSAANRLIGEVVQSRRRPLPGPSPGWKRLLPLSHLRHY